MPDCSVQWRVRRAGEEYDVWCDCGCSGTFASEEEAMDMARRHGLYHGLGLDSADVAQARRRQQAIEELLA